MKTWARAIGVERCGSCGHPFADGEPVLRITRAGQTWTLRRCATCADDAVPIDLPPAAPRPMLTVRSIGRRDRRDSKERQVGGES